MSLYDKASLIQVPSLYKDGLLVSTVPEDRSGDFAVARGANLSATRIGEDGYIKKGYENLLTYSNDFSNADWGGAGFDLIPNQTGYDGSSDAWLMTSTATGFAACRLTQGVSFSGVNTLSVYAKGGSVDFFGLRTNEGTSITWFELIGVGNASSNGIIEPLDDDWYRCSVYMTGSHSSYRIYIGSTFNNYNVAVGDSIYIQDAQLNQGLVAYPYLETTTAPAQGGLLENTPRLDWSNGVPAVKLEKGSTNIAPNSEHFGSFSIIGSPVRTPNATISPEGVKNAYAISVSGGSARIRSTNIIYANGDSYCFSVYAKANGTSTFNMIHQNNKFNVRIDLSNQTYTPSGTNDWLDDVDIVPFGNGWYRCVVYITMDANAVTGTAEIYLLDGDSVYVYGIQIEQGSTPSSYIPTYGTSQTRSNETVSDTFSIPTTATIYNSFYSNVAEQVYVLDQVFNVSVGLNKVAIAFSPTAIKISVGGSITANATGTYDTTSLSNIQLGSNNGTDYSNAPISGFYVFPEFLTDAELNSLTD